MTFTVLARDSGHLGAATASRSLAAGNAVIAIRPGLGAVASQAWTNPALRALVLDEMESGGGALRAISRIPDWDDDVQRRQVLALPVAGPPAAHSGTAISPWAGHAIEGDAVVAGNLLAGPAVVEAMLERARRRPAALRDSADAAAVFARYLVAILAAGEAAGGDVRGRQSAAVLVAPLDPSAGVVVDLRVDDAPDPIAELARLVELRAADLRDEVSARTA